MLCPQPGHVPSHMPALLSAVVFISVLCAYSPRPLISTKSELSEALVFSVALPLSLFLPRAGQWEQGTCSGEAEQAVNACLPCSDAGWFNSNRQGWEHL